MSERPAAAVPAVPAASVAGRVVRDGPMPHEPSAPCAACARGVDPLRAACVSMTERSVHYFCSRGCRESYLQREAEHEQKLVEARQEVAWAPHAAARPGGPSGGATSAHGLLQPVERRIAPTQPSTPAWPLLGAALFFGTAFVPWPGRIALAAAGLSAVALALAMLSTRTRAGGGIVAWLSAPLATVLLALAAFLGESGARDTRDVRWWLAAGAVSIGVAWLREHLLERAEAARAALLGELAARLSPRVRVSTAPPPATARATVPPAARTHERSLESLREGDEVLCEVGAVIPVDGVVSEGDGAVLPYPRASLSLARAPGDAVLAGALVVEGLLRVRATRVGSARALFSVFSVTAEGRGGRALALAERATSVELGLLGLATACLLGLLTGPASAEKLASVAAALLALPVLALAQGTRAALRSAHIGASARGVRYRDSATVERAGRIDTAVVRVEGVIVPRAYTLVEVVSLSPSHDADALLSLALAAASATEPAAQVAPAQVREPHAIAQAVRAYAAPLAIAPATLKRMALTRGSGVNALTDGQGPLVFGSRVALLSAGVSVAVADREAQQAEASGQRVVFLALGGRVRGLFVFAQAVRSEARLAVQTLFDLGIEVELVSGDHRSTVDSIARTLDVTQVKAELSAEQRASEVARLRDGEAHVAALGRAPVDELMLSCAELSLCLDASGQPHRHEPGQAVTYDISTASHDVRDAVAALVLARRSRRHVRIVWVACLASAAMGLLAATGLLAPLLLAALVAGVDWVCLGIEPRLAGQHSVAGAPAKMRERQAAEPESK